MATGPAMPERAPEMPERAPGKRPQRRARPRRGTAAGPPAPPPEEPGAGAADEQAALELLAAGELEVEGRLVVASNATLYCTIRLPGRVAACVYKPVTGERPLWDFPPGTLAAREVAAYVV